LKAAGKKDKSKSDLVVVVGAEVDGDKGEPDDAGAVHGEADVLGLVEVLGDLARLEGVQGAQQDEEHVVHERHHQRESGHAARQHHRQRQRVNLLHVRPLVDQPPDRAQQLHRHDTYAKQTSKNAIELKVLV